MHPTGGVSLSLPWCPLVVEELAGEGSPPGEGSSCSCLGRLAVSTRPEFVFMGMYVNQILLSVVSFFLDGCQRLLSEAGPSASWMSMKKAVYTSFDSSYCDQWFSALVLLLLPAF